MAVLHSKRTYQTYGYTCAHCTGEFRRRKDHGRDPRFCSYKCRGAATRARTTKPVRIRRVRQLVSYTCVQCGTAFARAKGYTKRQFTCSRVCRHARQRGRPIAPAAHRRRYQRTCRECGLAFEAKQKQLAVCKPCTKRRHRHHARAVRRARMLGVAYERINPIDVFKRDGWRCQLCGCSTPKRLRGQMVDRAPELDHIVPLGGGHGGTHTWSNVQCACRKCNIAKSDTPLGQLRF